MISLKNIQKTYTTSTESISLFKNLDWDIPTGTWVALMGASGSGKSTLLSLIAGIILPDILSPDTSHIHIAGTDITTLSTDARTTYRGTHIAFIFQGFELIPTLTVSENIDIILDISHAPRRYTTQYILDRVWLGNKWERYPSELSGGEQQRVAIARAFVADLPYLLADEPTGNLDEWNAQKIMELIRELHTETKTTIVMITHDRDIAKYANTIYRLHSGVLGIDTVW